MANPSPTAPRSAETQSAPSPAPATKAPVAVFRFESVSAAVFADPVKTQKASFTLLSVSLRRAYRDEQGAWQHTNSLRASDLLPAALALLKAYEFVADAQSDDAKGK